MNVNLVKYKQSNGWSRVGSLKKINIKTPKGEKNEIKIIKTVEMFKFSYAAQLSKFFL
jgi:hypothetical protein